MMGLGKKKLLLAFLNNSDLRLAAYSISGEAVSRTDYESLTFKSSVVKDSTILDIQAFQSEIAAFFSQKKQLGEMSVLLIIPEEKVFLKGFEMDFGDLEKKESLKKDFISEIPFEESDLIFHERQVGRVLEFSAVHRRFAEDFQLPFLNQKMDILGMVTVPQLMALALKPKEKSFLFAFYDNDFALALAENSSIIFSETRQMKDGNLKEAMRAFDHFVQHLQAVDIRSVSIILGEDSIEDALKLELEQREYVIKEIHKVNVLDMIAGYFNAHKNESVDWNLIRTEGKSMGDFFGRYRKAIMNGFLILLTLLFVGGVGWWAYSILGSAVPPAPISEVTAEPEVPAVNQEVENPTPVAEEPVPVPPKKSDFLIQIFNGTKLTGEAGRLKTILTERGFSVVGTGNNEDQAQVLTTIFVNSNVPDQIISDLRSVLEARYSDVLVSPSPVVSKDIHIVIGKRK